MGALIERGAGVNPRIPGSNESPLSEAEILRRRTTVVSVQEIDLDSPEELQQYHQLLKYPANRQHFVGVPETVEEFTLELRIPETHGLVCIDDLSKIVGYAVVHDAPRGRHDNFIEKFVVVNSLQGRRARREDDPPGVGMQFLDKVVEWGFGTPTHDGRERTTLHAAIVMNVPNWERPRRLFRGYGFDLQTVITNQADVLLRGMREPTTRDVMWLKLERENWERRVPSSPR